MHESEVAAGGARARARPITLKVGDHSCPGDPTRRTRAPAFASMRAQGYRLVLQSTPPSSDLVRRRPQHHSTLPPGSPPHPPGCAPAAESARPPGARSRRTPPPLGRATLRRRDAGAMSPIFSGERASLAWRPAPAPAARRAVVGVAAGAGPVSLCDAELRPHAVADANPRRPLTGARAAPHRSSGGDLS